MTVDGGNTIAFYSRNAAEYFASTVGIDMTEVRTRFVAHLATGSAILDAGCGSGRDAKAFADLGFSVTAFDASSELAALATQHCGFAVATSTFEQLDTTDAFDGIWCCSSLLHVTQDEMPAVLARLWRALRPGGHLFMCFKLGQGERVMGERRFTDANEQIVAAWVSTLAQVKDTQTWISRSRRADNEELWINVVVEKRSDKSD